MALPKVGDLLPGSKFKIPGESDMFLLIDKDTACLMFCYDSNEMSAVINIITGKMRAIENSKDVIPIDVKRKSINVRDLNMYEAYDVATRSELYTLFKFDEKISDFVLDQIFKDISEDRPTVIRLNLNRTFIISKYTAPNHQAIYSVQRVRINEIAV